MNSVATSPSSNFLDAHAIGIRKIEFSRFQLHHLIFIYINFKEININKN